MALTTIPAAGAKLRGSVLSSLITEVRPLFAYRSTDGTAISNNTSFVSDSVLTLAVEANAVYRGWLHVIYISTAVADLKLHLSLPTGATSPDWTYLSEPGATLLTGLTASNADLSSSSLGTGSNEVVDMWGHIITSSTAGSATLQAAQQTGEVSNTKILTGSFIHLQRMS